MEILKLMFAPSKWITLPVDFVCLILTAAREVYIPCDSPCNNGLCDYTVGRCVCHPFYTGEQCDRPLSECWSHDRCINAFCTYSLLLEIVYVQFTVVPCGDYYCFNEGTCEVDATGSKYCQCPQGIDEEYCLVNDCKCFMCSSEVFSGLSAAWFSDV